MSGLHKSDIVLLIATFVVIFIVGHFTDFYATDLNGGIVVGNVGIELWGQPGIFVCTPGNC